MKEHEKKVGNLLSYTLIEICTRHHNGDPRNKGSLNKNLSVKYMTLPLDLFVREDLETPKQYRLLSFLLVTHLIYIVRTYFLKHQTFCKI